MSYLHTLSLMSDSGEEVVFTATLSTAAEAPFDEGTGTYDIVGWECEYQGWICEVITTGVYDYGDYHLDAQGYGELHFISNGQPGTYTVSLVGESIGAKLSSVTWANDEQNPVIRFDYVKPPNSPAILKACISFTGATDDIKYRTIENTGSYTFILTDTEKQTLYTLLDKGTKATVQFWLLTYEDGESEPYTHSHHLPHTFEFINYKPVLRPEVWDVNPATVNVTGNPNHLVRYMSKAAYRMNIELRKGAKSVVNCHIQNGDAEEEGVIEGTSTEGVFENPTSNTFYFRAMDNRGHYGDATKAFYTIPDGEWIPYIKLTTRATYGVVTGEGKLAVTLTGQYFNASFGAINNQLSLQIMKNNDGSFSPPVVFTPIMTSAETYSYQFTIEDLDYTKATPITIRVNDALMTKVFSFTAASKPVFDWSATDFAFNVPVTINGATVPSIVEQGSDGTWTYRKWTDGNAECWCKVQFNSPVTTELGNLFTSDTISASNVTFPFTFTEMPVITATLSSMAAACWLMPSSNTQAAQKTGTTQTGRYQIVRATSLSNGAFTINYYVRGKWR